MSPIVTSYCVKIDVRWFQLLRVFQVWHPFYWNLNSHSPVLGCRYKQTERERPGKQMGSSNQLNLGQKCGANLGALTEGSISRTAFASRDTKPTWQQQCTDSVITITCYHDNMCRCISSSRRQHSDSPPPPPTPTRRSLQRC